MNHPVASLLLSIALASLAGLAAAQGRPALTATEVDLRAGPAHDYPVVTVLPRSFPLSVLGCLEDFSWCDVLAEGNRGWLYAGHISYPWQGSQVPLIDYGPAAGIGVLGFVVYDYWGHHYRNRPWYRDRDRWAHRPHPHPRPPRPVGDRPGRPPAAMPIGQPPVPQSPPAQIRSVPPVQPPPAPAWQLR